MSPKTAATIGRIFLAVGFVSLLGAWMTQWTGADFLGMSQVHLFSDATVFALLAIGIFFDAKLHSQKI